MFKSLASYLRTIGVNKLIYKSVPQIYHISPREDDLYALYRLDGKASRVDLSTTIDMQNRMPFAKGRKALTKEIKRAGFKEIDLYVPLPDYKTPVSIVYPLGFSDEADDAGFNVGTLLAGSHVFGKQKTALPTMSIENAWQVVGRNGLGQDLANSFLFVARQKANPESTIPELQHYKLLLPANYIDATPTNYIVNTEGEGQFFDLDWNFSIALPN